MSLVYILNEYDVTVEGPPGAGARRVVATLDKGQLLDLFYKNWASEDQEWLDEASVYLRRLIDKRHLDELGSIDLHDEDWDCRIQLHTVEFA